jgi:signal transduction histidine kinase
MGHELKRPVIAISGYLELVVETWRKAASRRRPADQKARGECELLNELNDFYLELLRWTRHGTPRSRARER